MSEVCEGKPRGRLRCLPREREREREVLYQFYAWITPHGASILDSAVYQYH